MNKNLPVSMKTWLALHPDALASYTASLKNVPWICRYPALKDALHVKVSDDSQMLFDVWFENETGKTETVRLSCPSSLIVPNLKIKKWRKKIQPQTDELLEQLHDFLDSASVKAIEKAEKQIQDLPADSGNSFQLEDPAFDCRVIQQADFCELEIIRGPFVLGRVELNRLWKENLRDFLSGMDRQIFLKIEQGRLFLKLPDFFFSSPVFESMKECFYTSLQAEARRTLHRQMTASFEGKRVLAGTRELHFAGINIRALLDAAAGRQRTICRQLQNQDLFWHLPLPKDDTLKVTLHLDEKEKAEDMLRIESDWVVWQGSLSGFNRDQICLQPDIEKKLNSLQTPRMLEAAGFLQDLLEKQAAGYTWSRQSGTGLLAGKGKFLVKKDGSDQSNVYELSQVSCKKDLAAWKEAITDFITDSVSGFDQVWANRVEKRGLEAADAISSLIERDILLYLQKVPYMNLAVLTKFLAGEKFYTDHTLYYQNELRGKYRGLLTSEEIESYAENLDTRNLIRLRWLDAYRSHGDYMSVRTLVKGTKALQALEAAELSYSEETLLEKAASKVQLNDSERIFLIRKMRRQSEALSGPQMIALLDAIASPGVLAACWKDIFELLCGGSDLLKTLAKTRLLSLPDGYLNFLRQKTTKEQQIIMGIEKAEPADSRKIPPDCPDADVPDSESRNAGERKPEIPS